MKLAQKILSIISETTVFAHIQKYLTGIKSPSRPGTGVGIITGWNPQGGGAKQKPPRENDGKGQMVFNKDDDEHYSQDDLGKNNSRMVSLRRIINDWNKKLQDQGAPMMIVFDDHEGSYGGWERSLVIVGISRKELIEACRAADQEAVIFAFKGKDGKMIYQYIQDGKVDQQTFHVSTGSEVKDAVDYFSAIGSRKYKIPFFDDEKTFVGSKKKHQRAIA